MDLRLAANRVSAVPVERCDDLPVERNLPGWVISDAESIRREVEPFVGMTDDERGVILAALCRDVVRILAARSDAQAALDWQDPVPESTLRHFERLRRESRELRDRG